MNPRQIVPFHPRLRAMARRLAWFTGVFRNTQWTCACLIILAWLVPTPSHAFVMQRTASGAPLKVDFTAGANLTFTYHLGTSGSVRGILSNEWVNARAAIAQWQAIPGTQIQFKEGPATISAVNQIPLEDGRIDIVWVDPGPHPHHPDFGNFSLSLSSAGQLAATYLFTDPADPRLILQAIVLVRRDLDYTTSYTETSANRPFLETVILHEFGHVLGANHSPLGTATLWWTSGGGVTAATGLSADEVAFAQSVYGKTATLSGLGRMTGTVRLNGAPVLGAVVVAERTNGIVTTATVSRANGSYELAGLPPGTYQLRVVPMDPNSGGDAFLVRGLDLDVTTNAEYSSANTSFIGTNTAPFSITANAGVVRDITVTAGLPPVRITEIRQGFQPTDRASADLPLQLAPGTIDAWVGVYVPGPISTNATLRISGDGIRYGPMEILLPPVLRKLSLIQVPVTVGPNATAGPRTLELTADGQVARAIGFIEVTPAFPDDNFDGLSDIFQRTYWSPFTQLSAAPSADPDGDGYTNAREAAGNTDPTNAKSLPLTLAVSQISGKINVKASVVIGKNYQFYRRDSWASSWQPAGAIQVANGEILAWSDDLPAAAERFYQVRRIP